jgi:PAS domain S-box-containing protein
MSADLEREIASLRERLEEAEDMRRAIVHAEVDGFVVGHAEEDQRVLLLAEAYSRYQQLFDEMQYGTVTVSANGEVLFANQRFAGMVGAPAAELFHSSITSFVAAEDRAAVAALLTTPLADGDGFETRLRSRDGSVHQVKISAVSASGTYTTLIVGEVGKTQAIGEAQETVDAIRRGEVDAFVIGGEAVAMLSSAGDPYQVLAERIQQGALTVSIAGRVLYANSRLSRMLGIPGDLLVGSDFSSKAMATDRAALAELLSGKSAQAEVKLRRFDGEAIETLISAATLANGQRMYLVTDLTEQKRHKTSDERMRKFLGMLAHELRNMLNAMRMSIELLKRQELNADCRKAVESIERQSGRMLQLVEDLRSINPKS